MALFKRTPADTTPMVPATEVDTLRYRLEQVTESLADLQREDRGWQALAATGKDLVNRDTLGRNSDVLRAAAIVNPLLRRARALRTSYVWGQGVTITGAEQDDKGQDTDTVVQGFLTDERNEAACFGAQAREDAELDLFTDGNHFRACFVNPMTGHTQVRPIPFPEITDIVTAPGDRYTTHYYLRQWTEEQAGAFGRGTVQRKAYYPDIRHQPLTRPQRIGDTPVLWPGEVGGAAIQQVKVNSPGRGSVWGIGDAWAALPYATGYKGFLEDWLSLTKTLSKIAWKITDPNGRSQQMRATANALGGAQGVGGVAATGTGDLQAVPKTGATIDADSGRPVAAMVAASLDLPVTMLLADPGVTGARATAETLDKPMRLAMQMRQQVWAAADRALLQFVFEQHVIAPRGSLKGTTTMVDDRLTVDLGDATDDTINVVFPDLDDLDVDTTMTAISTADGLDVLPPVEKAKLVFRALGMDNIPALIDSMTDKDGNWIPPDRPDAEAEGSAAANRFRRGSNLDGDELPDDE